MWNTGTGYLNGLYSLIVEKFNWFSLSLYPRNMTAFQLFLLCFLKLGRFSLTFFLIKLAACRTSASCLNSCFLLQVRSFPGGSVGREPARSAEDPGLILGLGRCPGEGHGNPLQYSCLKNPHGQRTLGLQSTEVTRHYWATEALPPCSGPVTLLVTFWNAGMSTFAGWVAVTSIVPWRESHGTKAIFLPWLPSRFPDATRCKATGCRRL